MNERVGDVIHQLSGLMGPDGSKTTFYTVVTDASQYAAFLASGLEAIYPELGIPGTLIMTETEYQEYRAKL